MFLDRGLKILEVLPNAHTIKEAKDRLLGESMIDVGELYLKTVKKAEKMQPRMNQYGKFVLYRKGKCHIYSMETLRCKKIKHGILVFKNDLPQTKNKIVFREFLKFDPDGFEKIDWGKMHLKQTDFNKGYYHFWGKHDKSFYNIEITKWTKRRMYFKAVSVE